MPDIPATITQQAVLHVDDDTFVDQPARDEAARAHNRLDQLPAVDLVDEAARAQAVAAMDAATAAGQQVYGLGAALTAVDQRVGALEAHPDDDIDDDARAQLAALAALVDANQAAASADITALSDLVLDLEQTDQAEDDQQNAALVDLANRIGSGGPGTINPDNAILLDSLPGATDDAKLDQAWALAQASNPKRPIRLSARVHTFTKTRTTFSGLRILGPNTGWQNPEIAGTSGALPQCVVNLQCGTAGSSWLVGTSTTYDVTVTGICFKTSTGAQFYHHPYSAGTCYAGKFDTLAFYGFKHVMGTPADPMSITLTNLSGEWTCVAVQDTQFSFRGSDSWLWADGNINYGWAGANGGRYLVRFSNLSKSFVANMYLTARGGSRAILVEGPASQQGALFIRDCVIEGQNAGDPAMGALIVVRGGGVAFRDIALNFGMARPSDFTDQADTALIMVTGGTVKVDTIYTNRANSVTEQTPIVAVSGGSARVRDVFAMGSWSAKPRAVRSGSGLMSVDDTVTA